MDLPVVFLINIKVGKLLIDLDYFWDGFFDWKYYQSIFCGPKIYFFIKSSLNGIHVQNMIIIDNEMIATRNIKDNS